MIVSVPSRDTLLQAVRNLSAAPVILARLGGLVSSVDTPLEEITAVLKCDAALSARLLRIANGVMYQAGEPCGSLEEAVLRVGFTEIYRLTGLAATSQITESRLAFYGVSAARFRENALLTALILEQLAGPDEEERSVAYTVGLLRSIGKIALDRIGRTVVEEFDYESHGRGPLGDWETEYLGMNNCEAAAVILKDWQFPAAMVDAIQHHYHPVEGSRLANLLSLAAGSAERCGHGWPGEHTYWSRAGEQFARAGTSPEEVDYATRVALESFGPVRVAVG